MRHSLAGDKLFYYSSLGRLRVLVNMNQSPQKKSHMAEIQCGDRVTERPFCCPQHGKSGGNLSGLGVRTNAWSPLDTHGPLHFSEATSQGSVSSRHAATSRVDPSKGQLVAP